MRQPLSIFNRNRNLPAAQESAGRDLWTSRDPFFRLQNEMNRMFDEVFSGFGAPSQTFGSNGVTPVIDLRETEAAVEADIELPGVAEDDIDVQIVDNALTVRGEKRSERKEDGKQGFHYVERSYGSFARTIPLPTEIDPDKVEAVFRDGVLRLTMPKLPQEKSRGRRIEIKRG